jgi:broad specificity phosphatase PhoE
LHATVILARHAATAANVQHPYLLQGLLPDSELVALGYDQAQAVAAALRGYAVAKIYSSPLKRAVQTAEMIATACGAVLALEPALVEADLGAWTGLSWPEVERRWPSEYRAFHDDAERHGYLGGENLAQVRDRALPVLQRLADRHRGETVAVVSHGGVLRALLAHWIGLPLRYARRIPQDNGGFSIVEIGPSQVEVRTVNVARHLAGLRAEAA